MKGPGKLGNAMELANVSGQMGQSMKAVGKPERRMDTENTNMMVRFTKEPGKMANATASGLPNGQMGGIIKEFGRRAGKVAVVSFYGPTVGTMREIGRMANRMVREPSIFKMDRSTADNGNMGKNMVVGPVRTLMAKRMKDTGKMENHMDTESAIGQIVNGTRENGRTEKNMVVGSANMVTT
jgi:hypothetical protein